jgi:hypothetical protein
MDGIYLPDDAADIVGRLEHALTLTLQADKIEQRLRRSGHVFHASVTYEQWLEKLLADELISKDEMGLLKKTYRAVRSVIMVDDFPPARKRKS